MPSIPFMIQISLTDVLPWFVVSSEAGRSMELGGFFKKVPAAQHFRRVRFSLNYLITASWEKFVVDLVDSPFPSSLYRSLYSHGKGKTSSWGLKKLFIPSQVKLSFPTCIVEHYVWMFGGKREVYMVYMFAGLLISYCVKPPEHKSMLSYSAEILSWNLTTKTTFTSRLTLFDYCLCRSTKHLWTCSFFWNVLGYGSRKWRYAVLMWAQGHLYTSFLMLHRR